LDGVRLWDLAHFAEIGHLSVPSTANVYLRPNGDSLFTYGTGGLLRWPIRRPAAPAEGEPDDSDVLQIGLPQHFDAPGNWLYPIFGSDGLGRRILAVDYPHRQALIFDAEEPSKKLVLNQPGLVGGVLSHDGRYAFTWSPTDARKSNIYAWDATEGKNVWQSPA